jgi:predicted transcriptional regulator
MKRYNFETPVHIPIIGYTKGKSDNAYKKLEEVEESIKSANILQQRYDNFADYVCRVILAGYPRKFYIMEEELDYVEEYSDELNIFNEEQSRFIPDYLRCIFEKKEYPAEWNDTYKKLLEIEENMNKTKEKMNEIIQKAKALLDTLHFRITPDLIRISTCLVYNDLFWILYELHRTKLLNEELKKELKEEFEDMKKEYPILYKRIKKILE